MLEKDKTEKSFNLVQKLVNNIIENPDNSKYRFLKRNNEKLKQTVFKYKHALALMELYGFVQSENDEGEDGYSFPETTSITTLKGKKLQVEKCYTDYKTYKILK